MVKTYQHKVGDLVIFKSNEDLVLGTIWQIEQYPDINMYRIDWFDDTPVVADIAYFEADVNEFRCDYEEWLKNA